MQVARDQRKGGERGNGRDRDRDADRATDSEGRDRHRRESDGRQMWSKNDGRERDRERIERDDMRYGRSPQEGRQDAGVPAREHMIVRRRSLSPRSKEFQLEMQAARFEAPRPRDIRDRDCDARYHSLSVSGTTTSEIKAWLLSIGFDDADSKGIVLHLNKPKYEVRTLMELFALEPADIDEILEPLPLGKKRVLKKKITEQQREG